MMAIMFCVGVARTSAALSDRRRHRLFPSSERNRLSPQYSTAIAINFYHTPVQKKSVRLLLYFAS